MAVIAAARMIDWTVAGTAPVSRTTIYTTLSPSATDADIVNALTACPAGQVVKLNAGTYNLTGLELVNLNNRTLRGAGPDQTHLVFSGGGATGFGRSAAIYIRNNASVHRDFAANLTDWTAGYTKGTVTLTFSTIANLFVGSLVILDQLDDVDTDTGEIWQCRTQNVVSIEGDSSTGRPGRGQNQIARVVAISGNQVTIAAPGLHMPNWRSGRTPQAYWSSQVPISGLGIENLSLDLTNSTAENGITMFNADRCWVRNVTSLNGGRAHILLFQTMDVGVLDSYFYGTKNSASQSYGIEFYNAAVNLVQNNIFDHVTVPTMQGGASTGNVVAYNYSHDNFYYVATWMQAGLYHHNIGINFSLFEGNDSNGFTADNIHGTSHFATIFRNVLSGLESGKTNQTSPMLMYNANRFCNVVGNVLGTSGYHTLYEKLAPSGTGNGEVAIFVLGWAGGGGSSSPPIANDGLVPAFLMRWGNYDVVNAAVRWTASEVPSGAAYYPNPVPPDQTLPASYYLAARPAWFDTLYGSVPWPPIGPDVTGGAITGVAGHANKIPARLAYEHVTRDAFNADNIYSQAATGANPPGPPTVSASAIAAIRLSLGAGAGATSHTLHRSGTSGFTPGGGNQIATFGATPPGSYDDVGLTPGTTYYYRLVAVNANGSTPSVEVSATTLSVPTPPTQAAVNRGMIYRLQRRRP